MTRHDPATTHHQEEAIEASSSSVTPGNTSFSCAADVPAAVLNAIASFVIPDGYVEFPVPTKNNAQRSLIYFYGKRVQHQTDNRSKWFCLASEQCRSNRTIISTTANISGCTRHLQVFHQLVSPKTLQMNRKQQQLPEDTAAAPERVAHHLPIPSLEVTDRDQSERQQQRVREWILAMVIRNLLPLSLANDSHVVQLLLRKNPLITTSTSAFNDKVVRHHIVEMYTATHTKLRHAIQKETSSVLLPILHLSLSTRPSTCVFDGQHMNSVHEVYAQVSYVSSAFTLERYTLGMKRLEGRTIKMITQEAAEKMVLTWLSTVCEAFDILPLQVQSIVVDKSSKHAPVIMAAASKWLGRSAEWSFKSVCRDALYHAASASSLSENSCLQRLLTIVVELSRELVTENASSKLLSLFVGQEANIDALLSSIEQVDTEQSVVIHMSTEFPWEAALALLDRLGIVWDAVQAVVPNILQGFTKNDIVQMVYILDPLRRFLIEMQAVKYPGAAEAVITAFALKNSTFSEHTSITPIVQMGADGEERPTTITLAELTPLTRQLRCELSSHWNIALTDGVADANSSALMCAFFHPCFRQLSFLEPVSATLSNMANEIAFEELDIKKVLMGKVKQYGREVVQRKASTTNIQDSAIDDTNDDGNLGDKTRKKRRLLRHERVNRQAEELSRLGFLEEFVPSSIILSEHGGKSGSSMEDDLAAADAVISREIDRYLKNESVTFVNIPFDQTLSYWKRKTLDYPTLAVIAQATIGHPVVSFGDHKTPQRRGCCSRCCIGVSNRPCMRSGQQQQQEVMTDMIQFLHLNQAHIPQEVPVLSVATVMQLLTGICRDPNDSQTPIVL